MSTGNTLINLVMGLYNVCSYSTHICMKYDLVRTFKMPAIVGILKFTTRARANAILRCIEKENSLISLFFETDDDYKFHADAVS